MNPIMELVTEFKSVVKQFQSMKDDNELDRLAKVIIGYGPRFEELFTEANMDALNDSETNTFLNCLLFLDECGFKSPHYTLRPY